MEDIVVRLKNLAQHIHDRNIPSQHLTVSYLCEAAEEIDRLRKAHDYPEYDATDDAHPAFWRGSKYSCWQATQLVKDILSGKDTGEGKMNEPAATMRNLILELKKDRDRLEKRVIELERD
ncbi:MAG: hypothetical protein ACTSPI_02295 [Candidatus Heimdallarchaeaceae archaeon]